MDNWTPLFKYCPRDQKLIETNLIYTPLISPSGTELCMKFDHTHPYQNEMLAHWLPNRPDYTSEMVKFFYLRERDFLLKMADKSYAPTVVPIDDDKQEIVIKWPGKTCNSIVYENENLASYCINWEEQLENIITDLYKSGFYKVTLYPHCFFIEAGNLKTFDFYGLVDIDDPYIEIKNISGMMGGASMHRFEEARVGDKLNLEILSKKAMESHIYWPNNTLNRIYNKLFLG